MEEEKGAKKGRNPGKRYFNLHPLWLLFSLDPRDNRYIATINGGDRFRFGKKEGETKTLASRL